MNNLLKSAPNSATLMELTRTVYRGCSIRYVSLAPVLSRACKQRHGFQDRGLFVPRGRGYEMAGVGRPGPEPGTGGAPRKLNPKPNKAGYVRTTVGPAGHGVTQYAHRVVAYGGTIAGDVLAPASSMDAREGIVDHINRQRAVNHPENLRIVTRAENNRNRSRRRIA